jgi:D-psicose/D-tagatose/L-ribulose 3-epimerase
MGYAANRKPNMKTTSHAARIALAILSLAMPLGLRGNSEKLAVQIGYCGSIKDIDRVKAAGFDYIELRTTEIAALSDADFEQLREKMKRAGLPVPAAYLFIPPEIKLTGPAINPEEQMNYVRKALDRLSRLGVGVVVFGSGGARAYPAGFAKDEAFRQLVDFCRRIAPEARSRNIVVAVEPLRTQESNLINSIAEGLDLAAAVNDPNIQLNLDFYHLEMVREDPAVILRAKDHIRHVHMANPTGRVFPLRAEEYDYKPLFRNLRQIGYQGGMSVEAATTDFEKEAPRSIAFLRHEMENDSK